MPSTVQSSGLPQIPGNLVSKTSDANDPDVDVDVDGTNNVGEQTEQISVIEVPSSFQEKDCGHHSRHSTSSEVTPFVAAEEVVVDDYTPKEGCSYKASPQNLGTQEDGPSSKCFRSSDNGRWFPQSRLAESEDHYFPFVSKQSTSSKPLSPAKVFMTEGNLRPFFRSGAQQGRQRYVRKREQHNYPSNDPPPELDIAAHDCRTLTAPMTQLFRSYGRSTLKQATLSLEDIESVEAMDKHNGETFETDSGTLPARLIHYGRICEEDKQAAFKELNDETALDTSSPPPLDNMVCDAKLPSTSKGQRVEKYRDWPLYWGKPIDFQEACDILTRQLYVNPSRICTSVPQNFRNEGTFVIDLRSISSPYDLDMDGLGAWGKSTGRSRFFAFDKSGKLVRVDDGSGKVPYGISYNYKCVFRRYEHTMTANTSSRFVKKVFTAVNSLPFDSALPLAIISYGWIGEPFDFFSNSERKVSTGRRAASQVSSEGVRSWEASSFLNSAFNASQVCDPFFDQWPLFAVGAVDFGTAACIILGGMEIDISRICCRVPQGYRSSGTFVIDVRNFATDAELRRDANGAWGKPAGHSRYYKLDSLNGNAIRVDRGNKLIEGTDFDVQILSKRYEHTAVNGRFVRKIYTGRCKIGGRFATCSNLAVITYYWKGEPEDFVATPQRKVRLGRLPLQHERLGRFSSKRVVMDEEEEDERCKKQISNDVFTSSTSAARVPTSEVRNRSEGLCPESKIPSAKMQLIMYKKQYENQMRFSALLDRAEAFVERLERIGDLLIDQVDDVLQRTVWYASTHNEEVQPEEILVEDVANEGDQYVEEIYSAGER